MQEYQVRQWTIEEFEGSRELWTELLQNSNNDSLFSSWEWQFSWWSTCLNIDKQLQLIAIYHQTQLVAIAPLFTYKTRIKRVFPITRAQIIGCSYEIPDTNRSDNIDIIVRTNSNIQEIYKHLSLAINSMHWHEFIINGAGIKSHIWHLTKHKKIIAKFYFHKKIYNYIIKLDDNFEQYSARLKKKVRQKAILHRRLIEVKDKNTPEGESKEQKFPIVNIGYNSFFTELNRLKKIRWKQVVYDNNRLKFQRKFIEYCQDNPCLRSSSSLILIEGMYQSAFYSISTTNQMYFLQFAFNPEFNSKISLGYLHLGYAIEQSYRDNLIQIQLLPGGGQSENYKHHFATKIQPQLTYRLIKNKYLAYLFTLFSK